MDELQHITYRTNPLFICITESWCSHEEPDSLYSIDGYCLFRKDRLFRAGGGVLIYVQDSQIEKATQLANLDVHGSNEELWIRIIPQFGSPLVVCCTYRPPQECHKKFLSKLDCSLRTIHAKFPGENIVITGDFNGKNKTWYSQDTTNVIGEDVQTLVSVYGIEQHVNFPTHEYSGQLKSCLDLVISNINSDHIHTQAEPPLGKSDHVVIRGSITLDATTGRFQARPKCQKICLVLERGRFE